MSRPVAVLFVCLGNICRSTMAEGIFQHLVDARGLSDRFRVESAGTAAYHVGERAHPRTREILARHGIDHTSTARRVADDDFAAFDAILAMDRSNLEDLRRHCPREHQHKLHLVLGEAEVPDPYYGTIDDYVASYALLRPALEGWLERLTS